ncbi:MAG TPA: hypothetical protein P5524_01150 [Candidatus Paceibacterota bacterium]|nr:hypothetical protein [Candidatus Paceibacterota bacterium]
METLITDGQKKQVKRFAEDAVDRALTKGLLDKDSIQRLIGNGGEFQADIIASIKKHSFSNQFSDEEVESSYGYPSGYKPKGITEQTNILRQLFPGVGFADEKLAQQPLPPNAEGWFAIPRWQSIAKTYNEAVQKVLDLIKKQYKGKFYACHEGKLEVHYLRQHERTMKKFEVLSEQQKGYDILVVAAQFGFRHRGRSVRRAREVFMANEFGLGAFEIGCMIFTHPVRLLGTANLWIDCTGDEYSPDKNSLFSQTPFFDSTANEFMFGMRWIGVSSNHCGSASGFLSQ